MAERYRSLTSTRLRLSGSPDAYGKLFRIEEGRAIARSLPIQAGEHSRHLHDRPIGRIIYRFLVSFIKGCTWYGLPALYRYRARYQ